MGQLDDKVAVITGGASGIGRACAERFVEEGATVVLGDLNLERAVEAAGSIEAHGGTAHAVQIESTSPADNETLMRTAMDKYGRLDVVVAAAGVSHSGYVSGEVIPREHLGLINQDPASWQRVIDVNLTGVMLTNQHAARLMIEAGNGGSIVNIASVAAKVPLRGGADYCVSKAGVAMLTKVFALEMVEHDIRVNAIGPGFVATPMTAGAQQTQEGMERMRGMTPMDRLGEPVEIANTALFLASNQSSYTTGQIMFPAGGMHVG